MPFDLGDHSARLVPRRRLILEVLVEALDLSLRRSPNGSGQPMRDLLTQDSVGRQADDVEVLRFFQTFVDRGHFIGGIRSEEPHDVTLGIPGDDRIEDIPPAIGAVDVAMAQAAGRSVPTCRTG